MHMHMAAALASGRSLLTLLAQTGVEIHSSPFVGTQFLVLWTVFGQELGALGRDSQSVSNNNVVLNCKLHVSYAHSALTVKPVLSSRKREKIKAQEMKERNLR